MAHLPKMYGEFVRSQEEAVRSIERDFRQMLDVCTHAEEQRRAAEADLVDAQDKVLAYVEKVAQLLDDKRRLRKQLLESGTREMRLAIKCAELEIENAILTSKMVSARSVPQADVDIAPQSEQTVTMAATTASSMVSDNKTGAGTTFFVPITPKTHGRQARKAKGKFFDPPIFRK